MAWLIETERLGLRESTAELDAIDAYELNLDPEVIKYTGDPPFASIEESQKFLSEYAAYRDHGFGRWAVILKDTNEYLGWCGLKRHPDQMVDLGFRFKQNAWGKGYATESARACIEWAFSQTDIQELVGRVAQENTASIRVLEKLGFTFWKKDECKGIVDSNYYTLGRDMWLNRKG